MGLPRRFQCTAVLYSAGRGRRSDLKSVFFLIHSQQLFIGFGKRCGRRCAGPPGRDRNVSSTFTPNTQRPGRTREQRAEFAHVSQALLYYLLVKWNTDVLVTEDQLVKHLTDSEAAALRMLLFMWRCGGGVGGGSKKKNKKKKKKKKKKQTNKTHN